MYIASEELKNNTERHTKRKWFRKVQKRVSTLEIPSEHLIQDLIDNTVEDHVCSENHGCTQKLKIPFWMI